MKLNSFVYLAYLTPALCSSGRFECPLSSCHRLCHVSMTCLYCGRVACITQTILHICWRSCYCLLPLSSPSVKLMMTALISCIWVTVDFLDCKFCCFYLSINVSMLIFVHGLNFSIVSSLGYSSKLGYVLCCSW